MTLSESGGVLTSPKLGMSNTAGEFMTFKEIADRDSDKSSSVSIVNCAVGGAGVHSWTQASSGTWSKSLESLSEAHFTPAQVQVAWVKHAEPMPEEDQIPLEYAKKVKADIATSLGIAKTVFRSHHCGTPFSLAPSASTIGQVARSGLA